MANPKFYMIFKAKTSIEYDVSKLVAHDGLTFNQVASSSFIQAHLECTPKKTLKSSNTISSMVRNCLKDGQKFSITSDEVTLINTRRFLNIVLKSPNEKFNLVLKAL